MANEPSNAPAFRWRIFPPVAIIAIGVLFLAGNLGYDLAFLHRHNGWAIVILLAALAPLARAYEVYRTRGRIDAETAYSLLSAAGIVLMGVLFLFELDWSVWWPLFVILGGLFTLIPRRRRNCHGSGTESDAAVRR